MNLIQNAIVYGRKGGNVWIRITEEGEKIQGEVRDDGIGIGEEHLDKIWDRFYRADPRRGKEEGTGLGLSMVKWIAKVHNGEIHVESSLGKGSRFFFWFPKKR